MPTDNDHWSECVRHAVTHANHLKARAARGEINASCIEGVMRGYLDQPAFWPEWRSKLLKIALAD